MVSKLACRLFALALLLPGAVLADDKPKVVTTFTVIADIAQNVAGDAATVESITKPGAEIHGYQPTPRDILRARNANLVLRNGLNLEQWFEKFLVNLGDEVPPGFARFQRLFEIVSQNDADKVAARTRMAFYKDRGYPITYRKSH